MALPHRLLVKYLKHNLLEKRLLTLQTFRIVRPHSLQFFKHPTHELIIHRWHLLHERCRCHILLVRWVWQVLCVNVWVWVVLLGIGGILWVGTIIRIGCEILWWGRGLVAGERGLWVWKTLERLLIFENLEVFRLDLWGITYVYISTFSIFRWLEVGTDIIYLNIISISHPCLPLLVIPHGLPINQLPIINLIIIRQFPYLRHVLIIKNPALLEIIFKLSCLHFHVLLVSSSDYFVGQLVVVEAWRFAVWVDFLCDGYWRRLGTWGILNPWLVCCWGVAVVCAAWLVCVKCVLLLFDHLLLSILSLFLCLLLLF